MLSAGDSAAVRSHSLSYPRRIAAGSQSLIITTLTGGEEQWRATHHALKRLMQNIKNCPLLFFYDRPNL